MSGRAVLNAAPVAVVPAAVGGSCWIQSPRVAFLVAGGLATACYVVALVLLLRSTWRPAAGSREPPAAETAG